MAEKLKGVIPPMITSFDKEGELYLEGVKNVSGFLADHVQGLFICGTYGGGPILTVDERKAVCETVLDTVNGRVPVIVHVGTIDTKGAVELAKNAEKNGAAAIGSLPPFYFPHGEDNVKGYFEALVDAVDIPVYLYNNPKTVGYPISPEFLARLKEEIGIKGVKDSSFDIMVYADYKRLCGEDFDVVLGTGAMFLPSLPLGGQAFIPGIGNVLPELMVRFWKACMNGDMENAYQDHLTISALRGAFKKGGSNLVTVQEMLKVRGIDAGYPRLPFKPLSPAKRDEVVNAIESLGVKLT